MRSFKDKITKNTLLQVKLGLRHFQLQVWGRVTNSSHYYLLSVICVLIKHFFGVELKSNEQLLQKRLPFSTLMFRKSTSVADGGRQTLLFNCFMATVDNLFNRVRARAAFFARALCHLADDRRGL